MGLFDKLFNMGTKASGEFVSDSDGNTMRKRRFRGKKRSFEEKLQEILQNAGNYELRKYYSGRVGTGIR